MSEMYFQNTCIYLPKSLNPFISSSCKPIEKSDVFVSYQRTVLGLTAVVRGEEQLRHCPGLRLIGFTGRKGGGDTNGSLSLGLFALSHSLA